MPPYIFLQCNLNPLRILFLAFWFEQTAHKLRLLMILRLSIQNLQTSQQIYTEKSRLPDKFLLFFAKIEEAF